MARRGYSSSVTESATNVVGAKEIIEKLRSLPEKIARSIERKGLRRALEPVLQSAVGKAPVGATGNLSNSLKIRTRTKKGLITGQVAATAPHAHLVEFGHAIRKVEGGPAVGYVPPHPFLRPALAENQDSAVKILADEISDELEKLQEPA